MSVYRTKFQEALERFDANPPEDYLAWKKKLRRQANIFLSVFVGSLVLEYLLLFLLVFRR